MGSRKIMRICFVGLDNYAFLRPDLGISHMGGEAVQQCLLAREFAANGFSVSTIVLDYDEPDDSDIDGIRIITAYKPSDGIPGIRFFHPRASGIWAALKKADADVYYESPASVLTGITAAFCRASSVASPPQPDAAIAITPITVHRRRPKALIGKG